MLGDLDWILRRLGSSYSSIPFLLLFFNLLLSSSNIFLPHFTTRIDDATRLRCVVQRNDTPRRCVGREIGAAWRESLKVEKETDLGERSNESDGRAMRNEVMEAMVPLEWHRANGTAKMEPLVTRWLCLESANDDDKEDKDDGNLTRPTFAPNGTARSALTLNGTARSASGTDLPAKTPSSHSDNILKDLSLDCDEELDAFGLCQTLFYVGCGVGALLLPLADRFGRKPLHFLSLAIIGISHILANFSRSFWSYLFIRGIQGCLHVGVATSAFVLVLETFPAKRRHVMMVVMATAVPLGGVFQSALSFVLPGWREMHLVLGILFLSSLLNIFVVDESIAWLATQDDAASAAALQHITRHLKEPPGGGRKKEEPEEARAIRWWRSPRVWTLVAVSSIVAVSVVVSLWSFHPRPLFDLRGSVHLDALQRPLLLLPAVLLPAAAGAVLPRRITSALFFVGVFLTNCVVLARDGNDGWENQIIQTTGDFLSMSSLTWFVVIVVEIFPTECRSSCVAFPVFVAAVAMSACSFVSSAIASRASAMAALSAGLNAISASVIWVTNEMNKRQLIQRAGCIEAKAAAGDNIYRRLSRELGRLGSDMS